MHCYWWQMLFVSFSSNLLLHIKLFKKHLNLLWDVFPVLTIDFRCYKSFWLDSLKLSSSNRLAGLYLSGLFSRPGWYHLPPPHPLSPDTIQCLLIVSGLICKVVLGMTVALAERQGQCFCVRASEGVCLCLDGFPSQWQDSCYDFTERGYHIQRHLPKQINTNILSASCRRSLRAGPKWKCSQMANWHEQQDRRLQTW